MCQPASWPCVNKCPSFPCYQENKCHQGRAPWTMQGCMHSLTFSVSEGYLLYADLHWAPTSLLQQPDSILHLNLLRCHPPHSSLLLFEKVLLSVTVLFIFFNRTSCLLLPHHLFYSEPLRCLFLPQLQWGCRLKCHRWPSSNQQMKQPFAQFPFCLSSWEVRQWWLIPPGSYLGHWLWTLLSQYSLCFPYSLFSVSPDPSSSFSLEALSRLVSELFNKISHRSISSSPQSFWFSILIHPQFLGGPSCIIFCTYESSFLLFTGSGWVLSGPYNVTPSFKT